MNAKELQALFDGGDDLARLPQTGTPFTDDQRKFIALAQAVQAAFLQLIAEGVVPFKEQGHYIIHLQDFMARLYAGETIDLGLEQSYKVDSRSGEIFLESMNNGMKLGRIEHNPEKPMGFSPKDAEKFGVSSKKTIN